MGNPAGVEVPGPMVRSIERRIGRWVAGKVGRSGQLFLGLERGWFANKQNFIKFADEI